MRSAIVPGGKSPGVELPDHAEASDSTIAVAYTQFRGRHPSFLDFWHDLRAVTGDGSPFHGWDRRAAAAMPARL